MTPKEYQSAKDAGMLTVVRLNAQTVVINCRCFNPWDGKEADPKVEQFNIGEVRKQLEAAREGLKLLDAFLQDMEAAPVVGLRG